MGYASYFEDILDRLNRTVLGPAEQLLSEHGSAYPGLQMFVRKCREIKTEVEALLELATDPTIDQLAGLRTELERAKAEREQLTKENANIRDALEHERKRRAQLEDQLKAVLMTKGKLAQQLDADERRQRTQRPDRGGLTPE